MKAATIIFVVLVAGSEAVFTQRRSDVAWLNGAADMDKQSAESPRAKTTMGGTTLFGTPKIGIADGWKPKDPGENPSCNILVLNTWHHQSAPVLCSTGGYDRCPQSVQCGAPFWSEPFVVNITETMDGTQVQDEKYDVVMLDWDANNFIQDGRVLIETLPHQSRSTITMESSLMHPMITQARVRANKFDFSYGFHNGLMTEQTSYLVSDPRVLYDGYFVPFEQREQRALVTTCIGSGFGERGPWVTRLNAKVSTHNLGWFLNNVPEDAKLNQPDFDNKRRFSSDGPRDKVEHFRKYKFCVAYENAYEEGYATEKLYDALRAGCIPIYKGAPDVKSIWHYAAQSVLFVDDFATMDALVDRIKQIGGNKTLFESFFAWRQHPIPVQVMKHLFHGLGNVACRACVKHREKRPSYDTPARGGEGKAPDWWLPKGTVTWTNGYRSPASWATSGAYFDGP